MFLATRLEELPRSLVGINWLLLVALLGGPRFAYRVYKDRNLDHLLERTSHVPIPVLVIGAREDADLFIRTTQRDPARRLSRRRHRSRTPPCGSAATSAACRCWARSTTSADVVARLSRRDDRPQRLILTTRGLDGAAVRRLLDIADELGISLARLPRLTDFQETRRRDRAASSRSRSRICSAGRRPCSTAPACGARSPGGACWSPAPAARSAPSSRARSPPSGRRGSRCSTTANSRSTRIDREIGERFPDVPRAALVGDVRDRRRIDEVMAAERPELVFHAAALKHVPMVEANPCEGILTNVLGTRNVAEACRAAGVARDGDDLDRQGGQSRQRHGRDQAPRREHLPGARPRRGEAPRAARASSPCASAMCWARPARSCRCSSASSPRAARSPSPIPRSRASS